jgi:predicted DNA-binding transcriptional regulator YafY
MAVYGSGQVDRIFKFAAFVITRRVPMTIPEIAKQTGVSRATAYRYIEAMRAHFPIEHVPGNPAAPGMVTVRSHKHG